MQNISNVTVEISCFERQLFLANIVDPELREVLLHPSTDMWSALSRRFEEDTGVYFERQVLKQALYMYLYSAGAVAMGTSLSETFQNPNIGSGEIYEFRRWAHDLSASPYLRTTRGQRVATPVEILNDLCSSVYQSNYSTSHGVYTSRDIIRIEKRIITQRGLDILTRRVLNQLADRCERYDLGNIEGLFTATTTLGAITNGNN